MQLILHVNRDSTWRRTCYDVYVSSIAYTFMRTNIEIDDKLIADTLRVTGLRTKREAVELGLRTLLRLRKQAGLKRLRGKVKWQGNLETMRRDS